MKRQPRKWTAAFRIERRYGVMRYIAEFTDGHLRASFYGSVNPLANSPSVLRQAAWEAAVEWISHVQPVPQRPMQPVRRIHFPENRQRRKHHRGLRRAAA